MTKRFRGRRIDPNTGVWSPGYFSQEGIEGDILTLNGDITVLGGDRVIYSAKIPSGASAIRGFFWPADLFRAPSTPVVTITPNNTGSAPRFATTYFIDQRAVNFAIYDELGNLTGDGGDVIAFGFLNTDP